MRQKEAGPSISVVVLLLCVTSIDGNCEVGFFGDDCSFKCFCVGGVKCNSETGECPPNVPCIRGMFGPGCQYVDAMIESTIAGKETYLSDSNRSSCNPDPKDTSLSVTLDHLVLIVWIRLHTDIDMSNRGVQVQVGNDSCKGNIMYRVSNSILDIGCESTEFSTTLNIEGPIVGHICDLEISGGRNVAVRQTAQQSTNFSDDPSRGLASHAVDGNTNRDFERTRSCTHTDLYSDVNWWSLVYAKVQKLWRIRVWNRITRLERLAYFKLELFETEAATTPLWVFNAGAEHTFIYDILIPVTVKPVKRLKISIKRRGSEDNILSMCEVQTFGETVCKDGQYGMFCQGVCQCNSDSPCHLETGVCGNNCMKYRWGTNCTNQCHPNCLENRCRGITCIDCKPGFAGPYCDDKKVCPDGKYGDTCEKSCSADCLDSKCNTATGQCLACVGKRVMPLCDKEEENPADDGGKEDSEETGFNLLYLLALLLLIPLAIIFFCCFLRKKAPPPPQPEAPPAPKPKPVGLVEPTPELIEEVMEKGSSVDITGEATGSGEVSPIPA